ncbi:AMP-binding enzyme family protein, partial [Vibrio parahaemolyticus V-223/04]
AKRKQH